MKTIEELVNLVIFLDSIMANFLKWHLADKPEDPDALEEYVAMRAFMVKGLRESQVRGLAREYWRALVCFCEPVTLVEVEGGYEMHVNGVAADVETLSAAIEPQMRLLAGVF